MRGRGVAPWLALITSCASAAPHTQELETVSSAPETVARFHDGMDAGPPLTDATDARVPHGDDAPGPIFTPRMVHADGGGLDGQTPAVPADASAGTGELAWLIAHIADTPDRLRSDDSDNTRQLAEHGAAGVRAMMDVFRRGDALRVPFARRVIERVILRQCRQGGRLAIQQITRWIELGRVPEDPDRAAPLVAWTRPVEAAWSDEALARLDRWVRDEMPCHPPPDAVPSTAPAGSDDD